MHKGNQPPNLTEEEEQEGAAFAVVVEATESMVVEVSVAKIEAAMTEVGQVVVVDPLVVLVIGSVLRVTIIILPIVKNVTDVGRKSPNPQARAMVVDLIITAVDTMKIVRVAATHLVAVLAVALIIETMISEIELVEVMDIIEIGKVIEIAIEVEVVAAMVVAVAAHLEVI